MTKPKSEGEKVPRINHSVVVNAENSQPVLKCKYCGDWIVVMPGTTIFRFVQIANFWSGLHNHYGRSS